MFKQFSARAAITVAAVSTVAVLCAPAMASAHSDDTNAKGHERHHSHLTDAQKACLAGQGITFSKDRANERDAAAKMKLWAALRTCGIVPKPVDPANAARWFAASKNADAARWFAAAKSANAARWFAAASAQHDHDGDGFRGPDGWSSNDRRGGSWHDGDRHDGNHGDGSWGHRFSGHGGFGH